VLAGRTSTWSRDHFCPQHDGAACIVADDVEPILGDIDSDHGDPGIGCLAHGDLHVLGALASLSLAGQEHGRTISLVEVTVSQPAYSSGTPDKRRPS